MNAYCYRDDEVVLQCSAVVFNEQMKLCLAAEGFGNRLCFLEPTSNAQKVPPDLAICCFILEQSLSVRALQEMLANTVEAGVEFPLSFSGFPPPQIQPIINKGQVSRRQLICRREEEEGRH
ncbi:ryanodine receptor 1 [Crotalus adamanteus]|uniref:Ryanodine receptor 1 n=1 Tax=Crotalus adamanteus TaxID=8729 RepID=A0AAW1AYW6_CROAD